MDEIVAFAELEKFIDLPVRTYSSGMFMRLGFSVAAHIQSDVLLLDEVFAVGDEQFQRKCFGKIAEFKHRGGTILFVSHDAQAVERLCDRAVLLRQGEVAFDGDTREAIGAYRRLLAADANPEELEAGLREWGSGEARIVSAQLVDDDGEERTPARGRRARHGQARCRGRSRRSRRPVSRSSCATTAASCSATAAQETRELGWSPEGGERELRFRLGPSTARRRAVPSPVRARRRRYGTPAPLTRRRRSASSSSRAASETGAVLLDGDWSLQEIGEGTPTSRL